MARRSETRDKLASEARGAHGRSPAREARQGNRQSGAECRAKMHRGLKREKKARRAQAGEGRSSDEADSEKILENG